MRFFVYGLGLFLLSAGFSHVVKADHDTPMPEAKIPTTSEGSRDYDDGEKKEHGKKEHKAGTYQTIHVKDPQTPFAKKHARFHPSGGESIRMLPGKGTKPKPYRLWSDQLMWSCPGVKVSVDDAEKARANRLSENHCQQEGVNVLTKLGCSSVEIQCLRTGLEIDSQVDCLAKSGNCNNYGIEKCAEGWEDIKLSDPQQKMFFAKDADGNEPKLFCHIKPKPEPKTAKKEAKKQKDAPAAKAH